MTEYKTFEDYVKNIFNIEPTELIHISPEEQKKKTVAITADELINIWNELTELKLKADRPKWHKVADGDLPTHSYRVLVYTDEGVGFGLYGLDDKKWHTYDTGFEVIAWEEIVLPELPKESE